eukprot:GHVQ01002121.1.p1 GENE.GHVQ01002121.1~~GHVQ01002121.1.p1  ORF type:complete len:1082 (+),score=164.66 GHVQ01002121.1:862-4107(+)
MLSQALGLPVSQQLYFSTHNALRVGGIEDQKFPVTFYETRTNRKLTLAVYPFYDVQMAKRLLLKRLDLPREAEIKDIRMLYKGTELPNYRVMTTFEGDTKKKLYFEIREPNPNAGIRALGFRLTSTLDHIINEARLAFQRNIAPKLTMDGTGGTYLLQNCQRKVLAVFKPTDEEAFAPFNPRGYEGKMNQQGFRAGVLSGEGASREVAAYFLDTLYDGTVDVPETTMVEACHPGFCHRQASKSFQDSTPDLVTWKAGSMQEFVSPSESCGNYDARQFSTRDVHNIGIFDIRVMNLDRNDGNILVKCLKTIGGSQPTRMHGASKRDGGGVGRRESVVQGNGGGKTRQKDFGSAAYGGEGYVGSAGLTADGYPSKYHLIPIDHGLVLPDVLDVASIDLVWYDWPQTKVAFSEAAITTVLSFDSDKDAQRLKRKLFIRDECLRTLRVATRLLQIGVRMHLTLHQISEMSARGDIDEPSVLETLVKQAMRQVYMTLDSASLISTNRLGYAVDLAESSLLAANRLPSSHCKSVETTDLSRKKDCRRLHRDKQEKSRVDAHLSECKRNEEKRNGCGGSRMKDHNERKNPTASCGEPGAEHTVSAKMPPDIRGATESNSGSSSDLEGDRSDCRRGKRETSDGCTDSKLIGLEPGGGKPGTVQQSWEKQGPDRRKKGDDENSCGGVCSSSGGSTSSLCSSDGGGGDTNASSDTFSSDDEEEEGEEEEDDSCRAAICKTSRTGRQGNGVGDDGGRSGQVLERERVGKKGTANRSSTETCWYCGKTTNLRKTKKRDKKEKRREDEAEQSEVDAAGMEDGRGTCRLNERSPDIVKTNSTCKTESGYESDLEDESRVRRVNKNNHSDNGASKSTETGTCVTPTTPEPVRNKEDNKEDAILNNSIGPTDGLRQSCDNVETTGGTDAVSKRGPRRVADEMTSELASLPSSTMFDYRTKCHEKRKRCHVCNEPWTPCLPGIGATGGSMAGGSSSIGGAGGTETSESVKGIFRGTNQGTVRRLNGTTSRGTAYRRQQELASNSTWALTDSHGRRVPVNWQDQRFERLFFETFELAVKKFIRSKHPHWQSYPHNGDRL